MTQSELTPLTEPRTCGAPSQSRCASAVSEWWSPKERNPLDAKISNRPRILPPEDRRRVGAASRRLLARHGR